MPPETLREATREVFWNIPPLGVGIMYLLTAVAVGIFGYGIYREVRRWRRGKPADRLRPVWPRLRLVLLHVAGHARMFAERVPGLYHFAFFWGFLVLFLGTVVVFIHHDLRIPIMRGPFYLYFQSATLDLMGLVAVVGVGAALIYRHVGGPPRLRRGIWSDTLLLLLFEAILLTGFVVEGLRIAATEDPWGRWSPVGFAVAWLVRGTGWEFPVVRGLHAVLWWLHFLLATAFVAYIPYSKLFHLLLAPLNVYLQPLEGAGSPRPLPLEEAATLGARSLEDFTWKDLLDLDVCTECGRCTAVCPASATGKPLSPMHLILDLRGVLRGRGSPAPLAGGVAREETLWACTTCMACMEACPVFIEHVPKILDLRRYLVMEEARIPGGMREALRSLEAREHPWAGTRWSRRDWYRGVPVRELREAGRAEKVDVVYWAGCAVLDERYQRVARALMRVLDHAGLRVGVLGPEERCTGDPARRIGDEFLFRTLATANLETFARYGVRRVVTSCPHCYNVLKNEYRDLGGNLQVQHHTELLRSLLRQGKLEGPVQKVGEGRVRVTYHDPCYLARYNGVVDPPREVLAGLVGLELAEMPRRGRNTFCCGAGGGRAWMEERGEERVALQRAREAVGTGAEAVAVSCPFCLQMLEDAVKSAAPGHPVRVLDVAELVAESLPEPERVGSEPEAE
ncbi:MAG: (Fe-S)-binding protein [Armatimonadota bacterium]|nr:(Fe-S)-binding protein [Armatimonadota bacterium]MDR7444519.1 (Fe-S)-binding protein [Armatimonadota bacterium]MDR7570685.1 (Fe-S)-binding protein [Armatimonadota bacterium]MDR7615310.1 (Fe-S)-binding protein [Armatimonadota bacterium]